LQPCERGVLRERVGVQLGLRKGLAVVEGALFAPTLLQVPRVHLGAHVGVLRVDNCGRCEAFDLASSTIVLHPSQRVDDDRRGELHALPRQAAVFGCHLSHERQIGVVREQLREVDQMQANDGVKRRDRLPRGRSLARKLALFVVTQADGGQLCRGVRDPTGQHRGELRLHLRSIDRRHT